MWPERDIVGCRVSGLLWPFEGLDCIETRRWPWKSVCLWTTLHRWARFWNSKPRLPLIIWRPRKTNFCFPFAVSIFCLQQTNKSCRFPLFTFSVYIYWWGSICIEREMDIYMYIYIYIYEYVNATVSNEKQKPRWFPSSVYGYHLLIGQMEVCHLSVCLWRNKRKLSVCDQTKQIFAHLWCKYSRGCSD